MADAKTSPPLQCVLIANRAEIACRVIRACKKLGIKSAAVFTGPDRGTEHTRLADDAFFLGERPGLYTDIPALVDAAQRAGATAVHPGYGFLSESPDFVEAVEGAGLVWLGPRAQTMRDFALKHVAKDAAAAADVPTLSSSPLVLSPQEAVAAADAVGYPVLLKATGGGGGMGIYKCFSAEQVIAAFPLAVSQGEKSFGNGDVFVEKYVQAAKHIEVQVFGDGAGHVVALGDRECSVQRRHQKVIEECPSPAVDATLRADLLAAAQRLCEAARYRSAGTVEFLMDASTRKFYFLEVNTRLQVEHGITELVTGTDIVEMMLRLQLPIAEAPGVAPSSPAAFAAGLAGFELRMTGHAIECRLCAEDPCHGLTPASGTLGEVAWPAAEGLRVDTWITSGSLVTHHFDSLLAKVMTHAATRDEAVARMLAALAGTRVKGLPTNQQLMESVLRCNAFAAGTYDTHLLETLALTPAFVEVVKPGVHTTVQDYPGRGALWHVGVPPSGPMDALSLRYANALVGNADDAAGLEVTLSGPTVKFHCASTVAVCGPEFPVTLDGAPVPMWAGVRVPAGATLTVGQSAGGARCYVAVAGGFDAPVYLGSRATFPSGAMGGYQGRALQAGDSCEIGRPAEAVALVAVPDEWRPQYGEALGAGGGSLWRVNMLPGPQADPDYFTPADMQTLASAQYEVHYNSNRLGVRLTGPRPEFARPDGGEGGTHPSNVHDHVYPLGAINFSGDMPIILTVDGPSLGGFACPATTIAADMWKWGQVRPGDRVAFAFTTLPAALTARLLEDCRVAAVLAMASGSRIDTAEVDAAAQQRAARRAAGWPETAPILRRSADSVWRLAGDRYLFVEYGDMVLDFAVRAKVAELEKWLHVHAPAGFIESSPGVRSALLEYDARLLPLPEMLTLLEQAEAALPDVSKLRVPSRVLRLPMAFRERWSAEATAKYAQSVRPRAAYLPDNVAFAAENNALEGGVDELRRIMFDASYMVFGLGDVYLGAPCAVPVNPLHRLVCPKYNPARTFTWEGTVGLGGAYLCVYSMNSPGGYQLVGRTLPIWNSFGAVAPFRADKPWLLDIFDQIRFYEVGEAELEQLRLDFTTGQYALEITEEEFDFGAHAAFCEGIADETAAWKARQQAASRRLAERDADILRELEADGYTAGGGAAAADGAGGADGEHGFEGEAYEVTAAPFAANVWEVSCEVGVVVAAGAQLCVLEAMKMETAVVAAVAGRVVAVLAGKGALVSRGQPLVVVDTTHDTEAA